MNMNIRIARPKLSKSAEFLLAEIARGLPVAKSPPVTAARRHAEDLAALLSADLLTRQHGGDFRITSAGRAHLARRTAARGTEAIDPFRAQHLALSQRKVAPATIVTIDETESPLAWLARRKGRDGRPLIEPVQLQAGERLRADFTRSQLMPHTGMNWSAVASEQPRGGPAVSYSDAVVAARQRVRSALDAAGPDFAGLLVDVCCFLKGLADVERERGWPPRSAKVVLQLGLDRLARHYGLDAAARGRARAPLRTWLAPDANFTVE
jgi:hypothetical protein